MTIKIGMNGFDRIARLFFRAATADRNVEIVGINDPVATPDYIKYLVTYDTVHGRFNGEIEDKKDAIIVHGKEIKVSNFMSPAEIPWARLGGDYIVESTSSLYSAEKAHGNITTGAKKVIISRPAADAPIFIMGYNHEKYTKDLQIVSAGSCTTNCLGTLLKVIDKFGIEEAFMTAVHAMTGAQRPVDGFHKKWRPGRAAGFNIIPSSGGRFSPPGGSDIMGRIFPQLKGRIMTMSFSVPVADVSVMNLTCVLKTPTNYDAIKTAMKEASEGSLKGLLGFTEDEVVSSDFIDDPRSAVFDAGCSGMLNDHSVRLVAWYDNEWSFPNKMLMLIKHMAKVDAA